MTVHSPLRGEGKRQDSKPSSPASVALLTTPPRSLSPRLHALLFQTWESQCSPNPIKRSPLRISIPEQSSHWATKITQRKPLIIYSPAHTVEKFFFLIAKLLEREKQNSKLLSFFSQMHSPFGGQTRWGNITEPQGPKWYEFKIKHNLHWSHQEWLAETNWGTHLFSRRKESCFGKITLSLASVLFLLCIFVTWRWGLHEQKCKGLLAKS